MAWLSNVVFKKIFIGQFILIRSENKIMKKRLIMVSKFINIRDLRYIISEAVYHLGKYWLIMLMNVKIHLQIIYMLLFVKILMLNYIQNDPLPIKLVICG